MSEGGWQSRIGVLLREKKSLWVIAALVVLGAVLMLIGAEGESESRCVHTELTDVSELEERVRVLCERVEGVSDVSVMITLDTFGKQMYAFNAQQSYDGENKNERLEYVTTSGGLVPTGELMPQIRGVAVVCRGGDEPAARLKLTEMLCALFDIASDSVSIVGSK